MKRHLNPMITDYFIPVFIGAVIAMFVVYGMFTCKPVNYPELW